MKHKTALSFPPENHKTVLPVIWIMLLLIPASFAFAGGEVRSYRFGLQDCIDYALKNHTVLLNQRLSQFIVKKNLLEAYGQYFPQVTAGASYQYNIKQQVAVFGGKAITIGTREQLQGQVDVSQSIFEPGLIGNIAERRLQLAIARQNTRLTEINLVAGVMKSYYGVLVSREQMTLLTENITVSEKELQDTQTRYENGLAQKVDVDRIQVLVNNAAVQKRTAVRNLETQMQSLKFYMGMPVNDSLEVTGAISEDLLKPEILVPESNFYKQRVEYIRAQNQLQLSRHARLYATLTWLPSLSAFGTYEAPFYGNSFEGMFDIPFHPTVYAGIRLSLPVFTGFTRIYQRQIAELNVEIASHNLDNLRNDILLQYHTNDRLVKNDRDNLEAQKTNIKLAQANYESIKYQYDNGVQPIINVLNAYNTLLEARNGYINALYQLLLDQVDLEQSMGHIQY